MLAFQFERPAGAGVEFEFADFADAIGPQPQTGAGQGLEPLSGLRVQRIFADQAAELLEVTGFERLGDLIDELRGIGGGNADAEVFQHGFRVLWRGGLIETGDLRGWRSNFRR